MTTYTISTDSYIHSFRLVRIDIDDVFEAVTSALQVAGKTGNHWELTLNWENVDANMHRVARSWASRLGGRRHRLKVEFQSALEYERAGIGTGTPQLVGAHSAGATQLSVDGMSGSITGWLLAGDLISIGNELKEVRADVNVSAGAGTIEIWPELHKNYSDNQGIEITNPVGVFYKKDDSGFGAIPHPTWLDSMTLSLKEDVLA